MKNENYVDYFCCCNSVRTVPVDVEDVDDDDNDDVEDEDDVSVDGNIDTVDAGSAVVLECDEIVEHNDVAGDAFLCEFLFAAAAVVVVAVLLPR